MDTIFLRELKIDTLIGVYDWERLVPQTLQIDLDIGLPNSMAYQSDNIDDALDYSDIVKHLKEEIGRASCRERVYGRV